MRTTGFGITVLIVICGALLLIGCSRRVESPTSERANSLQQARAAPNAASEPQEIRCPPAGTAMLQPDRPDVGHHRVMLSWKASVPSLDPKIKTLGYCLYRSRSRGAAKKNPRCQDCEQVNTVPIPSTQCTDDLVEDGVTYYYVATAIASNRELSVASNEVTAPIPKKKSTAAPPSSYPLCRAIPSSVQPAAQSQRPTH